MKSLKNISFTFLITILLTFILMFFVTCLSYIDLINVKITNILKFIIPLFSSSIGGFILGKKATKKGFLEGLKLGVVITFILSTLNLIIYNVTIKNIIFYILIIICAILGSMFGINMKKEENN